jgi:hypothetical protein
MTDRVVPSATARVFTSTSASSKPMRALLQATGWTFGGELDGLDEGDAELVFYQKTGGTGSDLR